MMMPMSKRAPRRTSIPSRSSRNTQHTLVPIVRDKLHSSRRSPRTYPQPHPTGPAHTSDLANRHDVDQEQRTVAPRQPHHVIMSWEGSGVSQLTPRGRTRTHDEAPREMLRGIDIASDAE